MSKLTLLYAMFDLLTCQIKAIATAIDLEDDDTDIDHGEFITMMIEFLPSLTNIIQATTRKLFPAFTGSECVRYIEYLIDTLNYATINAREMEMSDNEIGPQTSAHLRTVIRCFWQLFIWSSTIYLGGPNADEEGQHSIRMASSRADTIAMETPSPKRRRHHDHDIDANAPGGPGDNIE